MNPVERLSRKVDEAIGPPARTDARRLSPSQLAEYVRVMRRTGVLVLKLGDDEIHLGPPPPAPARRRREKTGTYSEGNVQDDPDDALTFAHTEGYPADLPRGKA